MFENQKTPMADAFERAGVERDETPQEAAERIWNATKRRVPHAYKHARDPVETMRLFDEWARGEPSRMEAVIGRATWHRLLRGFLERDGDSENGWSGGHAFKRAMWRLDKAKQAAETADYERRHPFKQRRARWDHDQQTVAKDALNARRRDNRADRRHGLKKIYAKVDVANGCVVSLMDREIGPFAHIRIGKLNLSAVTPRAALKWCESNTTDVHLVRALCRLMPDQDRPIGEQCTAEMIQTATETAQEFTAAHAMMLREVTYRREPHA
jgi:hypothetical protein